MLPAALIVCGIGLGMFFAPSANLVLSTVRPEEQGIASGANNAIREVGGAIGVATPAAVLSGQGGYGSASEFAAGLTPAFWTGAGAVALAAAVAPLMPRQLKAYRPALSASWAILRPVSRSRPEAGTEGRPRQLRRGRLLGCRPRRHAESCGTGGAHPLVSPARNGRRCANRASGCSSAMK
jgi:hypothetical protein